jgi:hypothetical protein
MAKGTTPDGLLSAQQGDVIAAELVRIHTAALSVPANFVHSVFPTYPRSHAYVVANRSPISSIVGVIRAGHTSEEKSRLVQSLWRKFQDKTEVSDRDLSIALQEVPASQAMEKLKTACRLRSRIQAFAFPYKSQGYS